LNLTIIPEKIQLNETTTIVSFMIKNRGEREGTEDAQLYIRDEFGSVTTPIKSLKGFQRLTLQPDESKYVKFEIGFDALSLWNKQMKRVVEPGTFKVLIGSSFSLIHLEGLLIVTEEKFNQINESFAIEIIKTSMKESTNGTISAILTSEQNNEGT
jgi:beta-glucosidase